MDKLEQCAQVLFDSDSHTALSKLYAQNGRELSWDTAPTRLKKAYIRRATHLVTRLGYSLSH